MIRIQVFDVGGTKKRVYENLVPVGTLRPGDNTNRDLASNQLVQFFLRTFFRRHPELFPRGSARSSVFLLDGQVGEQTVTGINRFQVFARRSGIPVLLDSRVSVATGINVPGTGNRWTIHALNSLFLSSEGQMAFDNLFANPEIQAEAPELAAELVREEQLLRS